VDAPVARRRDLTLSPASVIPEVQVRGIRPERIVLSTTLDPYMPLKVLAAYAGMSVRLLRHCLTDPAHPLPHYRARGKILVRRSEFDGWIARYRQAGRPDVDKLVGEVLHDLRAS
jgi:hypothetical protein